MTYEYIQDILHQVDGDNIIKKKKSIIKPSLLLLVGAVILYLGTTIESGASDMLSSLLITLGIGVMVWGLVAFVSSKECFVYKPTGKVLKKHKVYVSPNQSFRLQQILEGNKYDELKSISQQEQSNLSLDIFCTDDHQYAVMQALEFVPYNDVPTTPAIVCQGEKARLLAVVLAKA